MHAFRAAVEARDLDAVAASLAEDVVFYSPVAFAPYTGRALVTAILRRVIVVLETSPIRVSSRRRAATGSRCCLPRT